MGKLQSVTILRSDLRDKSRAGVRLLFTSSAKQWSNCNDPSSAGGSTCPHTFSFEYSGASYRLQGDCCCLELFKYFRKYHSGPSLDGGGDIGPIIASRCTFNLSLQAAAADLA